jgi:hypothetical protein
MDLMLELVLQVFLLEVAVEEAQLVVQEELEAEVMEEVIPVLVLLLWEKLVLLIQEVEVEEVKIMEHIQVVLVAQPAAKESL